MALTTVKLVRVSIFILVILVIVPHRGPQGVAFVYGVVGSQHYHSVIARHGHGQAIDILE